MVQVVDDLDMWNMSVAPKLVNFRARVLPQEKIIQGLPGREKSYESGANFDWTAHLRCELHPPFLCLTGKYLVLGFA